MTEHQNDPLVSIGLPVYNSASKFVASDTFCKAIDSLLAQTYSNIELIIVDNASTDNTSEVCQEYAQKDQRIRLYRNPRNMGALYSGEHVYRLAKGKYFMWAADDDYWEPDFIRLCLEQLETHPTVDLCYPLVQEHNLIKNSSYMRNRNVDDAIQLNWKRAVHLLEFKLRPHAIIYGIFRRESIEELLPLKIALNPDLLLLHEFASRSKFMGIQKTLMHKYVHPKNVKTEFSAQQITIPTFKTIKLTLRMLFYFGEVVWASDERIFNKMLWTLAIVRYFIGGVIYVLTLHRVRL